MKPFKTTLSAALIGLTLSTPALSEDANPEIREGAELLERGFQLLLEGLANEFEPMAEDMAEGWADLMERLGDMTLYHAPETLPNGDIIIRRKDPLPVPDPETGETEI